MCILIQFLCFSRVYGDKVKFKTFLLRKIIMQIRINKGS